MSGYGINDQQHSQSICVSHCAYFPLEEDQNTLWLQHVPSHQQLLMQHELFLTADSYVCSPESSTPVCPSCIRHAGCACAEVFQERRVLLDCCIAWGQRGIKPMLHCYKLPERPLLTHCAA